MAKQSLAFVLVLVFSISGHSQTQPNLQPDNDKIEDAQATSQSVNYPSRREVDGGVMVLGVGSYGITRLKVKNDKVLEAERTVQEIKARLWREAPEMAAAREKYKQVHDLRTLEETAEERKKLETLVNELNRTSGTHDAREGVNRIFNEEDIKSIRDAETRMRASLLRDKESLISLSEKTERIKLAQKGIQEAEKIQDLQRKAIQLELDKAEFSLKLEENVAWRRIFKFSHRYYKVGGVILIGLGAWDFYRQTENNTVGWRIATPDEIGKLAVAVMATQDTLHPH